MRHTSGSKLNTGPYSQGNLYERGMLVSVMMWKSKAQMFDWCEFQWTQKLCSVKKKKKRKNYKTHRIELMIESQIEKCSVDSHRSERDKLIITGLQRE